MHHYQSQNINIIIACLTKIRLNLIKLHWFLTTVCVCRVLLYLLHSLTDIIVPLKM